MKKDFSRLRRLDLSVGGDNTVTDKLVQVSRDLFKRET